MTADIEDRDESEQEADEKVPDDGEFDAASI